MSSRPVKNFGLLLILIIFLGLLGGAISDILSSNVKAFAFLGKTITFGIIPPMVLDIKFIVLTLGLRINVNLLTIVGMLVGVYIYVKKCR